jgi:hypothetical protein
MNKTIGNLILMTLICVAVFIVFMAIRPAKAQWRPWGWQHSMSPLGVRKQLGHADGPKWPGRHDVGPGWLQLGACNARSSLGVPNGFTVAALTFV